MSDTRLREAETCLFRAWPAPTVAELSGWMLRAGRGGHSRVNSVFPLDFDGRLDLDEAVARAEDFYRQRGLPSRFQMLDLALPSHLDDFLGRRGYAVQSVCDTLALSLPAATGGGCDLSDRPEQEWLAVLAAEQAPERTLELPDILGRLPSDRVFASVRVGGRIAGIGLGVRWQGDVALECIATDPSFRRRGVAARVVSAIAGWAQDAGADRAVLAVLAANDPAAGLYRKLGFERIGGYAYRVLSRPPGS